MLFKKDPQRESHIACMVSKWILIKRLLITLAISVRLPDSVLSPSLGVEVVAFIHFVNALKAITVWQESCGMEQSFISGILAVWRIKEKSRLCIYQTSEFMIRLGEVKNTIFNSFWWRALKFWGLGQVWGSQFWGDKYSEQNLSLQHREGTTSLAPRNPKGIVPGS